MQIPLSMASISVIVPIYKAEQFLDRCVESLVRQTVRDMEIVLVDDASPDKSGDICDAWKKRISHENISIVVIHRAKNGGHSAARNSGLEVASGDYIGFVDSDDYVLPEMYERLMAEAEHTDADVVQGGYHIVSADGCDANVCVDHAIVCESLAQSPELLHRQTKFVWDKIFRRDMLIRNKIRFREDILFHEDFLFLAEVDVALRGYAVSDYSGYVYYVRREGSSTTTFDERLLDCTKALSRICGLMKNRGLWLRVRNEVLKNALESFMLRIRDLNSYSNVKLQRQLISDWWSFLGSNWIDWRKQLLSQIGSRGQRLHFTFMTLKPVALLWVAVPLGLRSCVVSCAGKCATAIRYL